MKQTESERISASNTSDCELIALIQRTQTQNVKETMGLNKDFSEEEIKLAKKYLIKWSACLAIRRMQVNTTVIFLLTPERIATIKRTRNARYDMWKRETSFPIGRNTRWSSHS